METNNKYDADLYLRLSREDGDKAESDSIANQRELLLAFLSLHPEISLHKVRVDDGYSGVDYNCPDFQNMMESVKNKEINCIIVKDFSRLGRNFIETGKYIERIFPFMGVRFISVNDDYDSIRTRTASDNLIVPVKNLINDAYCRDISIKIRSHLEIKRKKGQCIAPFAAYGYRKDERNRNQLVVDEEPAAIVQEIFKRKLDGFSAQAIADWLNEQDILSPMEYKLSKGSHYSSTFKRKDRAQWTAVAVFRILKNPVYIGTLVQGKRSTPNYKVKKLFDVPKEQWVSIPDSHEAIVSKEIFENVAALLLADTRTAPSQNCAYPLSGLVYCGDCGRSMVRKNNSRAEKPYIYYVCSGHKNREGCRASHSIRDQALEGAVLAALKEHITAVLDIEDTLKRIAGLPYTSREVKKADKKIQARRQEIEKYQHYKMKLHEDFTDGLLSREDYMAFGKRYDARRKEAEEAVQHLEAEIENLVNGNTGEQQWISHFKEYRNIDGLTRKLVIALVDRIEVYEGKRIRIFFKFQMEYDSARMLVQDVEQADAVESFGEVLPEKTLPDGKDNIPGEERVLTKAGEPKGERTMIRATAPEGGC